MHAGTKLLIFAALAIAIVRPAAQAAPAARAQATPVAKATAQPQAAPQKGQFRAVTLDSFVEQEKKAVGKGKRIIRMAAPISFEARVKRHPEERPMHYVYEVLEMSGVKPLPEVGHRMFVESRGGRIIPVYVEKQAAARIGSGVKVGKTARFLGYHLYSYGKGPAVLVVDFDGVK
jgi:hypothetical protein